MNFLKYYMDYGLDYKIAQERDIRSLYCSVETGDLEAVKSYLEKLELSWDNEDVLTKILTKAISHCNKDMAEYLTHYIIAKVGKSDEVLLLLALYESETISTLNMPKYYSVDSSIIEFILKHIESSYEISKFILLDNWKDNYIRDIAKARKDWLVVMEKMYNDEINDNETICKYISKMNANYSYRDGETALMRASKLGLYEVALAIISAVQI